MRVVSVFDRRRRVSGQVNSDVKNCSFFYCLDPVRCGARGRRSIVAMERVKKSMRSGLRIVGNAAVGFGGGSVALVSTALPESGGAVDLIAVRQPTGELRCSPWHVRFGKYQGLLRATEKVVTITVNGVPIPEVTMRLGRSGVAYFVDKEKEDVEKEGEDGARAKQNEIAAEPGRDLTEEKKRSPDDSLGPVDDEGDTDEESADEHDCETSVEVENDVVRENRLASDSEVPEGISRRRFGISGNMTGSASDDGCGGARDVPSTTVGALLGLESGNELVPRSHSCGDFLGTSGSTGAMAEARFDALRRIASEAHDEVTVATATQSVDEQDLVPRKAKSKSKRRVKKRFTATALEVGALAKTVTAGKNLVTFQFTSSVWGKQTVKAHLWVWGWQAKVVISDVDGTITKSDVLGHLAPMVGKDWNHAGIARLYNSIKANGFEFLFLSSRAVSQSSNTRRYLEKLTQDGETLTQGPVLLAPDSISTALYREVVTRQPQVFKMECLANILRLFPGAGVGEGGGGKEEGGVPSLHEGSAGVVQGEYGGVPSLHEGSAGVVQGEYGGVPSCDEAAVDDKVAVSNTTVSDCLPVDSNKVVAKPLRENRHPFYAGFGNRDTDAVSYASVGVPPERIFTINPKSEIVAEISKHCADKKRWDLGTMIECANSLFPPDACCESNNEDLFETANDIGIEAWIDDNAVDDAFIDKNYWGRGSCALREGEELP
jgi:phosphatidate phosphatase LPIN